MVAVSDRVNKPKTRRGKRALENRAPKVVENDKTALIVKGGKTSEVVSYVLGDIYQLKKPLATQLKRKNPFHPLEDETPIERFCSKFDSSLFLFGSNSKKHPNSLVFGRTHDGHLLDMVELNATKYFPAEYFKVPKTTFGSKPMILLEGPDFETDATKKRLGNLLVDWFRGATVDKVRLQGLETVISFTAQGDNIFMRVYRVLLKKSTSSLPRVELAESGPRVDFRLGRNKLALESLYKAACKQPKQISAKKRKNTSEDVFGTKLARVHVGKQPVESLQTRKTKALKTKAPAAQ